MPLNILFLQIDVENPCVIMSQDKSREFLHSGNDKEKFKVCPASEYFSYAVDVLLNNECNVA